MPKEPQGQKRPADTVSNAIRVAKILTGEVEEDTGADDIRTPQKNWLLERAGKTSPASVSAVCVGVAADPGIGRSVAPLDV